ncbi:hypothetical protein Patl1_07082 [Pistacia atlantica]|uniref:Uncharacterized protein n=1 Tax=Pistacia atlantica TaxID=434234 RepID=A0ACC1AK51_9ROSI|nr:hypothetical protein Patl1_07082 [Pistacia atlantica]
MWVKLNKTNPVSSSRESRHISSSSPLHCYSHKKPAQAALVFLANDVTSDTVTVTGGIDSSALRHKRQDDDIQQMDKIKMEVGGKVTANIVLEFQ